MVETLFIARTLYDRKFRKEGSLLLKTQKNDVLPPRPYIAPCSVVVGWFFRHSLTAFVALPRAKPPSVHFGSFGGLYYYIRLAATYSPTLRGAVPSARQGLTTLFGMGKGGSPTL